MFVVGGESLIDLVSEPREPGGTIAMHAHQGGSPYNCAIALAKLGVETGFLCPISRDGFGDYLLEPLAAAGVRPLLPERTSVATTLAVVTLNERMQARYEFYRGADRAFPPGGMAAALPEQVEVFQTGGFAPIELEDAAVWLDVLDAATGKGAIITLDPNVRPSLITDFAGYKKRLDDFFDRAHVVKMSEEDMDLLRPGLPIEDHARLLLQRPQCGLVVVTLGERGSLAFSRRGHAQAGVWSPPVFGDTVGAGDSLMAGILTALKDRGALRAEALPALGDDMLGKILRFGAVVAGINCGRKGCNPPTRAEVDAVLSGG